MLFANHLFVSKLFLLEHLRNLLCYQFFFNFWKPSQMVFTCSKQCKHEFVKYVKYVWKPNYSKSIIKAQEEHKCVYRQLQRCGFWGTSQKSTLELFFAIQHTKVTIFNWVLNISLKFKTDLTLINWLWFGWVTFMSTFIQIFQTATQTKYLEQNREIQ